MWNKILNWKLLAGSHEFPGPDGGTCINEAAIIAAGYEYKSVSSVNDCPPCFSRVIAAYSIGLNDRMPHDLRQELLLPFVTRLAGTVDPAKEIERAKFISLATINRVLPICLRSIGLEKQALACEAAQDLKTAAYAVAYAADADAAAYAAAYAADADAAASAVAYAAYAAAADTAASAVAYAADADAAASAVAYAAYAAAAASAAAARDAAYAAAAAAARDAAYAAGAAAADAAGDAADAVATKSKIFEITVAILAEAIEMGNHASEPEISLIHERLESAKRLVTV